MKTKPKILVFGVTGQVGKATVPHLKDDPKVEVIAAVRNPEKAAHLGVAFVHLDLDKIETIEPALQGIDRAFLVTGYTIDMMRQSKDFLNAAKRAGVKQIVHLGACGDNDTRIAHYGWHQFIERYIEWCGFSFTHLRPEIFMQNMLGYGGESYIQKGIIRHYIGGARLSWVTSRMSPPSPLPVCLIRKSITARPTDWATKPPPTTTSQRFSRASSASLFPTRRAHQRSFTTTSWPLGPSLPT
jgi:NAD(P)H dehydrogenase (quinone)